MKNNRVVVQKYATALLETLQTEAEIDQALEVFETLVTAWESSEELRMLSKNPFVKQEKKKAIYTELLAQSQADSRVSNLVFLLLQNEKISLLKEIYKEFSRLSDQHLNRGIATVKIVSPLSLEDEKTLRERLEKIVGCKVKLRFEVEPAILGGFVVEIGNRVLDFSISGQMERFREVVTKIRVK